MRHPRFFDGCVMLAVAAFATRCSYVPTLCVPQEGTVGFFSKGDCALTKASSFRGHEWITYLGNQDLPASERFDDGEVAAIVEGNRRVDWPKELLVHLAHSVVAYTQAAVALQDRPENQRIHFLLDATNDSRAAVMDANGVLRDRTREGVRAWASDRTRALTVFGQACHTLQDSFSRAHTLRDPGAARPWCVRLVKSYLERAPGFDVPTDQVHGGRSDDAIGHTTTEDSIYRQGRDCNDPETVTDVDRCMNDEARRARLATRDYLRIALELARRSAPAAEVDVAVDALIDVHTSLCP